MVLRHLCPFVCLSIPQLHGPSIRHTRALLKQLNIWIWFLKVGVHVSNYIVSQRSSDICNFTPKLSLPFFAFVTTQVLLSMQYGRCKWLIAHTERPTSFTALVRQLLHTGTTTRPTTVSPTAAINGLINRELTWANFLTSRGFSTTAELVTPPPSNCTAWWQRLWTTFPWLLRSSGTTRDRTPAISGAAPGMGYCRRSALPSIASPVHVHTLYRCITAPHDAWNIEPHTNLWQ